MNKLSFGQWAFILFRVITYIPMFFDPFWGILISFFADLIDSYILYYFNVSEKKYHQLDKPLDYILYIIIFLLTLNTEIFPIILFLIIFRSIGMYLFNKTHKRYYFVLFPNYIEFVYLVYIFDEKFLTSYFSDIRIWIILVIFKLVQETLLHWKTIGSPYTTWKLLHLPRIYSKNRI